MNYAQSYRPLRSLRWTIPTLKRRSEDARTLADKNVAERLQIALDQLDLQDVASISVYVRNGLVTIQGLVTSEQELRFISDMARRVDGVRHVITHLTVVSPEELNELEMS